MEKGKKWPRILYGIGISAVIIGALDPLEGSVVILAGSIMATLSGFIMHDRFRKLFLVACLMIAAGVFFLFYFSSLGGFGGTSSLSWWWGTLILPYPAGWIMTIVVFIVRQRKTAKRKA